MSACLNTAGVAGSTNALTFEVVVWPPGTRRVWKVPGAKVYGASFLVNIDDDRTVKLLVKREEHDHLAIPAGMPICKSD